MSPRPKKQSTTLPIETPGAYYTLRLSDVLYLRARMTDGPLVARSEYMYLAEAREFVVTHGFFKTLLEIRRIMKDIHGQAPKG